MPSKTTNSIVFSLMLIPALVVSAMAISTEQRIDAMTDQLGTGSAQQVLAAMLVLMVLAVIFLFRIVMQQNRSSLKERDENNEKAHKERDKREDDYRKAFEGVTAALNRSNDIQEKCHDRTAIVIAAERAEIKRN